MIEDVLHSYLMLTPAALRDQLLEISARQLPAPGKRQVPFRAVETLLCYGLFSLVDPHRYGGGNIHTAPQIVYTLAAFFRRSPSSLTNKMLNLDGSRPNGAREEPLLFAYLATRAPLYRALYGQIMSTARQIGLDASILPDFLDDLPLVDGEETLLGQDDLPTRLLLGTEEELRALDAAFALGDLLTEKLVERKVRLAQHRFARSVLENCGYTCVFCGFEPRSLPEHHGLLRASHIKPWAQATSHERVDVRNGLAACPIHDAAFDQGYLTVNGGYRIRRARVLRESIARDAHVSQYFGETIEPVLFLPPEAKKPAAGYLHYHNTEIFKGDDSV